MINSLSQSPSFEGKAVVKFNKNKIGILREQLNQVAKNMGKSFVVSESKDPVTPEMLDRFEKTIRHDQLFLAKIEQTTKRGNTYNAIIVTKDSDDMLVRALKRVCNNEGSADNVMSYADYISKSAKK